MPPKSGAGVPVLDIFCEARLSSLDAHRSRRMVAYKVCQAPMKRLCLMTRVKSRGLTHSMFPQMREKCICTMHMSQHNKQSARFARDKNLKTKEKEEDEKRPTKAQDLVEFEDGHRNLEPRTRGCCSGFAQPAGALLERHQTLKRSTQVAACCSTDIAPRLRSVPQSSKVSSDQFP